MQLTLCANMQQNASTCYLGYGYLLEACGLEVDDRYLRDEMKTTFLQLYDPNNEGFTRDV